MWDKEVETEGINEVDQVPVPEVDWERAWTASPRTTIKARINRIVKKLYIIKREGGRRRRGLVFF